MRKFDISNSKFARKTITQQIKNLCILLVFGVIEYVLIEISSGQISHTLSIQNFRNIVLGIGTVMIIIFAILTITGSYLWTIIISAVISVGLSILNHYVIQFHGQPFTTADIANTRSAITVIQNYSLPLDSVVIIDLFCFIAVIIFAVFFFKGKSITRYFTIPVFIVAIGCFYFAYMSPNCYISRADTSPNWVWALQGVGYTPYFVHRSIVASEPVKKPDGYDDSQIQQYAMNHNITQPNTNENYPDIIFILNETYYDLDTVINTGVHDEVFSQYDSMEAIKGYTVAPQIGGGTNCSEFEYLTGNSIHLIPYASPFVFLDMTDSNTVISYLQSLGYNTLGMHQFDSTCYSRNVAYPKIGFDDILWKDDCVNLQYYGQRTNFATDTSVYENLTRWYEQTGSSSPKCMYCLTIQNHGNWELNDEKEDIIHTVEDFGDYTDDMNEYLSCIKYSDDGIKYLIDYFSSVDRNVIIVMAGDHCPSFLPDLVTDVGNEETILKMRSTPFFVWTNHMDLDKEVFESGNRFSMNYLMPCVLKAANLPLPGYYEYLINLKTKYPIIEKDNGYYDSNYVHHSYSTEKELPEDLQRYFGLEYFNITTPTEIKNYYD